MLLAALLAGSHLLYVARQTTYGCSSLEQVNSLERIRGDRKSFDAALYEQIFAGQCVQIGKGKVVEGSTDGAGPSVLLVDRQLQPPGFLAPLRDFRKVKPHTSRNSTARSSER
jgi:hypothetical protein